MSPDAHALGNSGRPAAAIGRDAALGGALS
jgi:hypothetical protein